MDNFGSHTSARIWLNKERQKAPGNVTGQMLKIESSAFEGALDKDNQKKNNEIRVARGAIESL